MPKTPVTCLVDSRDSLGEGCLWDVKTQSVWWLDIARPSRIHCYTPTTGAHREWHSMLLLTTIARRKKGGFVLGGEQGVYLFNEMTGAISPFASPETDRPQNRFNDGSCDPQGRLWIGSMENNIGPDGEDTGISADTGALYRVDAKGKSQKFEDDVGVSNGPCWSPNGKTFYFSDSKKQLIYAYDFDGKKGAISNRRVVSDVTNHGYPDGATVDAEGFIWSARWDGACILRINPKGGIDRIVEMPALRPTCVCFGGKNLDTMYATSSRAYLGEAAMKQYPLQGGLFCFDPGVKGLLKNSFAG